MSAIYHLCDTNIYCVKNFLEYNDLQTADFFLAQCSIGFTILFFSFGFLPCDAANLRNKKNASESDNPENASPSSSNPSSVNASGNTNKLLAVKMGCQTLIVLVAAIGSPYKMNLFYYLIIIGIGTVVLLLRCVSFFLFLRKLENSFDENPLRIIPGNTWHSFHKEEIQKFIPKYNFWLILIGGISLIVGVINFSVQESDSNHYWLYHSLWHACGLGSVFFFLLSSSRCSMRPRENAISKSLNNWPLLLSLFDFGPFWKMKASANEDLYEDSIMTSLLHSAERKSFGAVN